MDSVGERIENREPVRRVRDRVRRRDLAGTRGEQLLVGVAGEKRVHRDAARAREPGTGEEPSASIIVPPLEMTSSTSTPADPARREIRCAQLDARVAQAHFLEQHVRRAGRAATSATIARSRDPVRPRAVAQHASRSTARRPARRAPSPSEPSRSRQRRVAVQVRVDRHQPVECSGEQAREGRRRNRLAGPEPLVLPR